MKKLWFVGWGLLGLLVLVAAIPLSNQYIGVANTTALQSYPSVAAYVGVVRRVTDGTVGAPSLDYKPSAITPHTTPCTLNAGAGDGGSQIPSSDGNCWLAQFAADGVDERQFANGSSNVSAAIQAAGTYLCLGSGGIILVPAGTFTVHDVSFACPIRLRGAGVKATTLNIASATSYGLQWQAPSFPSNGVSGQVTGGRLDDLTITDTASTVPAVQVEGFFGWRSRNIYLNNVYTGVLLFGDNDVTLENYQSQGVRNIAYFLKGDISGVDGSNVTCTTSTAECTTETQVVTLRNLNNGVNAGGSAIGIKVQGFVGTVDGEHFIFENYGQGLNVSCPSGLNANMMQCPHFLTLHNFQNENFHTYGVNATDFINMKLTVPFLVGDGTASNVNDILLGCTNYCGSSTLPGLVTVRDGYVFATQNDCIKTTGAGFGDVNFSGNQIFGCDLAVNGSGGINLQSTMLSFKVQDNQFCQVDGYVPGTPPSYGVQVGANAAGGIIKGNNFYNCARNVINSSTNPYTIIADGNLGPGIGPTLTSCGTSTITGTDNDFTLTAGSSPSICTVIFGSQMMRTPSCVATTLSGSSTTVVTTSPSATEVILNFGAGLTGGAQVHCGTGG